MRLSGLVGNAARALCAVVVGTCLAAAQTPATPPAQGKATLVYVGSTSGGSGGSILLYRLQSAGTDVFQNVTLVPLGSVADSPNPVTFQIDVPRRLLFVVNDPPAGAMLTAFKIDDTGKLSQINQQPIPGSKPCYLALDGGAHNAVVADCGSGNLVVLPIAADGKIGAASENVATAHASCVALSPDSKFVYACDAASDRIAAFAFDPHAGKLRPATQATVTAKAGSSPHRIAFRPDGKFAYVLGEKSSTVTTYAVDPATGSFKELESVSTVPEYFDGPNSTVDMQVDHTGRFLFVSNRGHDSVVLLKTDKEKGVASFVEEQGTAGRHPAQLGIQPTSLHMVISLPETNTVLASRIDADNGRLKPSELFADIPATTVIRFLPPVGPAAPEPQEP